jgi:hypothetical protein
MKKFLLLIEGGYRMPKELNSQKKFDSWRPKYRHRCAIPPPQTNLNSTDAIVWCYKKLRPFLGVGEYINCPAEGWGDGRLVHRHLFRHDGFHRAVRWMPVLKRGWRRMQFGEFLGWYGIQEKKHF